MDILKNYNHPHSRPFPPILLTINIFFMKQRRTDSYWAAFFKAVLYSFRTIIHFRKPATVSIDYIPLLVQQKPVLLLSWNFPHAYSLSLKPMKKTYHQASGAYILRLEENCKEITLTIRSFWRRTRLQLKLVPVPATDVMLSLLERDLAISISLHMVKPVQAKTDFEIRRPVYKLPSFNIQSTISTFYIDAEKLNIDQ
jgi:hypothetical protein